MKLEARKYLINLPNSHSNISNSNFAGCEKLNNVIISLHSTKLLNTYGFTFKLGSFFGASNLYYFHMNTYYQGASQ